jgi:hypothetical protein
MSIRSLKIPGERLGLGTFVNSDIDQERLVVYHGEAALTAGNHNRTLTQGQTKMATIKAALIGRNYTKAIASASVNYTWGTISGGTINMHVRGYASAAATNATATKWSYWIVGTPDPNRIVI